MTRDDIIRMARESGCTNIDLDGDRDRAVMRLLAFSSQVIADTLRRLGQPERKPIAWLRVGATLPEHGGYMVWKNDGTAFPVFRHPERKPLTDEQILDEASHFGFIGSREPMLKFVRAIEAAHGIKGDTE